MKNKKQQVTHEMISAVFNELQKSQIYKKLNPKEEKRPHIFKRIYLHFHNRNEVIRHKIQKIKELKFLGKQKHKQLHVELSELKEASKVNLNEMLSDLRYFKPSFFNRIWGRLNSVKMCMAVIHFPQSLDIVRYYKMPKPFVLDIKGKKYLFTPKAFRFINGMPKLEFYANIPFAILHNVSDKYIPPSVDAEAFTAVQDSKFIQDAVTTEEMQVNMVLMIIIIIVSLVLLSNFVLIWNVFTILGKMPK